MPVARVVPIGRPTLEIASGNIAFAAGDNLTVEKLTGVITFPSTLSIHPGNINFLLAIEKPTEDTAGNLTINTYNQIAIDGTNVRDVLHTVHTVEKITGAPTYRDFLIQGLFIEGSIKIGAKFVADSGAITVAFKLFSI